MQALEVSCARVHQSPLCGLLFDSKSSQALALAALLPLKAPGPSWRTLGSARHGDGPHSKACACHGLGTWSLRQHSRARTRGCAGALAQTAFLYARTGRALSAWEHARPCPDCSQGNPRAHLSARSSLPSRSMMALKMVLALSRRATNTCVRRTRARTNATGLLGCAHACRS